MPYHSPLEFGVSKHASRPFMTTKSARAFELLGSRMLIDGNAFAIIDVKEQTITIDEPELPPLLQETCLYCKRVNHHSTERSCPGCGAAR